MKRLLLFLSLCFICIAAVAETITIKWENGNTTYSQSTCTVGGDLNVPATQPTKYGYDFVGWKAKAAHELEYLTIIKGAYIDTGIVFDTNEIEFDIKFEDKKSASYTVVIFGVGGTYSYGQNFTTGCGLLVDYLSGPLIRMGAMNSKISSSIITDEPHICNLKIASNVASGNCDEDEIKSVIFNKQYTNTGSVFLGGLNNNGDSVDNMSAQRMQGDIYYFKIKKDGVLVLDLIPAQDTDGIVCFYDRVTKKFFYNAGGAEFVAGPEKVKE